MSSTFLTNEEIVELTHCQRKSNQARALRSMGVVYLERPDGSLAVLREVVVAMLGGERKVKQEIKPEPQLRLRNSPRPD